jgi:hypothetical protein
MAIGTGIGLFADGLAELRRQACGAASDSHRGALTGHLPGQEKFSCGFRICSRAIGMPSEQ